MEQEPNIELPQKRQRTQPEVESSEDLTDHHINNRETYPNADILNDSENRKEGSSQDEEFDLIEYLKNNEDDDPEISKSDSSEDESDLEDDEEENDDEDDD